MSTAIAGTGSNRAWLLLALAVVVSVVHGTASTGGFHYDDAHSVADNPALTSLQQIPRYFHDASAFSTDGDKGMYRPVLLTTYAIDYALHGGTARGYLRTNLLLHVLNALAVALIAWLLIGRTMLALSAGALFGLHPAASEPVYYVSARSDSLVALLVLASVTLWLWGRSPVGRLAGWMAVAGALWSKATAVMLPVVLLSLDVITRIGPGKNDSRELLRRHVPWVAVLPVYLGCLWWTQFLPRSLAAPVRDPATHLLTQTKAVAFYLRMFLFPVHGSVHPAFAVSDGLSAPVVCSILLTATLICAAVALWRGGLRRHVIVGIWIVAAMLPTALMPLNVLVNERRAYLPLAVVVIAVAWALARLRRAPGARIGVTVVLLLMFASMSQARAGIWASDLTLWQDAVRKGPQMPRARLYLADAHRSVAQGSPMTSRAHVAAARAEYDAVISLGPSQRLLYLQALNGLAILDLEVGDLASAEQRLTQVLAEHPDYVDALVNLGSVCFARARETRGADVVSLQRASELYGRAVQLAPLRTEARLNLGASYHLAGDLLRAQAEYETVVAQAPDNGTAALNLGLLYMRRADDAVDSASWVRRAIVELERAARLQPGHEAPRRALDAARGRL